MGREFDVRLRGIQALAGKTVRVCVDGEFFGAMRVSGYGSAYLHRHAPAAAPGEVVRIRTQSGRTVARTVGCLPGPRSPRRDRAGRPVRAR